VTHLQALYPVRTQSDILASCFKIPLFPCKHNGLNTITTSMESTGLPMLLKTNLYVLGQHVIMI